MSSQDSATPPNQPIPLATPHTSTPKPRPQLQFVSGGGVRVGKTSQAVTSIHISGGGRRDEVSECGGRGVKQLLDLKSFAICFCTCEFSLQLSVVRRGDTLKGLPTSVLKATAVETPMETPFKRPSLPPRATAGRKMGTGAVNGSAGFKKPAANTCRSISPKDNSSTSKDHSAEEKDCSGLSKSGANTRRSTSPSDCCANEKDSSRRRATEKTRQQSLTLWTVSKTEELSSTESPSAGEINGGGHSPSLSPVRVMETQEVTSGSSTAEESITERYGGTSHSDS